VITNKALIFFILLSFSSYSQDSIRQRHLIKAVTLTTASVLPHYIAYITYINNKQNPYAYLYTGVWFSFGLTLDVEATYHFIQYHKLKKKSLFL
jgi:hypothetical protein